MANQPAEFLPTLPRPVTHGGVYMKWTLRWLPGDALPLPATAGRRYGTFRGLVTWAQESHSGRWTLRGPVELGAPPNRVLAGCSSWWRASRLAAGVERRLLARASETACVTEWLERVW